MTLYLWYNRNMGKQPECGSRPGHSERGDIMPATKARIDANRRYNEKAYDRIELKVPKGQKAELQEHAQQRGESLNAFVNRAIDHEVERDTQEGNA